MAVNQQSRSMKTYKAAMAADLLDLQKRVEDLDIGPREDESEPRKADRRGSVFGFGFGLPKMG
jgi:hypothetical protein